MTSKPAPTLYPIEVVELPKPKSGGAPLTEVAAFRYLWKNGYELIDKENHAYWGLWTFLCLDQLRYFPQKEKWDRSKTVPEIPEIFNKLTPEGQRIANVAPMPLSWEYSAENIMLNGNYGTVVDGSHYYLCKEKIDNHILNLKEIDYIKLLKDNYYKYDMMMRNKYFLWVSEVIFDRVLKIAMLLPIEMIQVILTKCFKGFFEYRTGFPDFTMQSKDGKNLKLVEVKGVREKIKDNQHYWLNKFVEHGVDASVLRVKFIR